MPINVIPKFLQKAFADTGAKTNIPLNADLVNGRAGYAEGFPPINMTAVAAGGIPPFGQDINGVLYDLSAAIQYQQSGVLPPFNSAFATAIGGYEIGAIVSDASDKTLLWVNGTANNTSFPSGWTSFKRSDPTEYVRGMPLVATQSEINAGANDTKMVTSKKLRAGFTISLTSTGYIAFPSWLGGVIIQWGASMANGDSESVNSYPLTFPTECRALVATPARTLGSTPAILFSGVRIIDNGLFGIRNNTGTTNISYWIAVGH